jgi:hypothetical protein
MSIFHREKIRATSLAQAQAFFCALPVILTIRKWLPVMEAGKSRGL